MRLRFSAENMALGARFGFSGDDVARARALLGVTPAMRVLEVGCGTGAFTRFLLPALEGRGAIVAIDADEEHLATARKETDGAGVAVRFEKGDAFALPAADASFDAVVSQFLLCVLPEPLRALREMRRVARPGGVVASISCFCKSGALPWFHGAVDWPRKERYLELAARFRATYRTTVRNPMLGLPNGRDLDVWADYRAAGLEDLRITGFLPVYAPADARWTDEDGIEYMRRRERVELGLLDNLSDAQLATLEAHGFSRDEVRELREATALKYATLTDARTIRANMDAFADPSVVITGRVPGSRG